MGTDVLEVLSVAAKVERAMKSLYHHFSTIFADNESALTAFRMLEGEEEAHHNLIQYQRRLVRNDPKSFKQVDVDMETAKSLIQDIEQMINRRNPSTLEQAVAFALRCETNLAELHYRMAMEGSNPEIARLIRNLGDSDETHMNRLRDLARDYGVHDSSA